MKDLDFVNSSTYIRVQENKLLSTAELERMAEAADTEELYRLLGRHPAYNFGGAGQQKTSDELLDEELERTYQMAYGMTEYPELVDILACRYDFHNLKVALKAQHPESGAQRPYIRASRIPPQELENAVIHKAERSDLPPAMLQAVLECLEAQRGDANPQDIDMTLDRAMFAHMLELSCGLDNDFVTEYVRMSIDFYNLKALVRVKGMEKGTGFLQKCLAPGGLCDPDAFLQGYAKPPGALAASFGFKYFSGQVRRGVEEYEKTKNYAVLERLLDNTLIEHTKQVKYLAFGPEVLLAYLVSKENELRQVRILLAGKKNNLDAQMIRERLRENYV